MIESRSSCLRSLQNTWQLVYRVQVWWPTLLFLRRTSKIHDACGRLVWTSRKLPWWKETPYITTVSLSTVGNFWFQLGDTPARFACRPRLSAWRIRRLFFIFFILRRCPASFYTWTSSQAQDLCEELINGEIKGASRQISYLIKTGQSSYER